MCVWPGGVHGPSQGCRKNTRSSCTLFPAYSRHLMSVDSLLHAGGVPGGRVEGLPPSSPGEYLALPPASASPVYR